MNNDMNLEFKLSNEFEINELNKKTKKEGYLKSSNTSISNLNTSNKFRPIGFQIQSKNTFSSDKINQNYLNDKPQL